MRDFMVLQKLIEHTLAQTWHHDFGCLLMEVNVAMCSLRGSHHVFMKILNCVQNYAMHLTPSTILAFFSVRAALAVWISVDFCPYWEKRGHVATWQHWPLMEYTHAETCFALCIAYIFVFVSFSVTGSNSKKVDICQGRHFDLSQLGQLMIIHIID